jgi:hypothetical protein
MATSTPTTVAALKTIATKFLNALCTEPRDLVAARALFADVIHIQHDSNTPTMDPDQYTSGFQKLLESIPDFRMEIVDTIAEVDGSSGAGGRVWIYSRITGNAGKVKHRVDSVDMMTINEAGKIVKSKDVQRPLKEDEEKPT